MKLGGEETDVREGAAAPDRVFPEAENADYVRTARMEL